MNVKDVAQQPIHIAFVLMIDVKIPSSSYFYYNMLAINDHFLGQ